MFTQVRLAAESFLAYRAREDVFGIVAVLLRRRWFFDDEIDSTASRLMPPPVRRQVGGAVEDLVALRTPVFHVHDTGTAVLRQTEGIFIHFPAETADVVANTILYLRQLRFRFFRNLYQVEGGVDVAFADN